MQAVIMMIPARNMPSMIARNNNNVGGFFGSSSSPFTLAQVGAFNFSPSLSTLLTLTFLFFYFLTFSNFHFFNALSFESQIKQPFCFVQPTRPNILLDITTPRFPQNCVIFSIKKSKEKKLNFL